MIPSKYFNNLHSGVWKINANFLDLDGRLKVRESVVLADEKGPGSFWLLGAQLWTFKVGVSQKKINCH